MQKQSTTKVKATAMMGPIPRSQRGPYFATMKDLALCLRVAKKIRLYVAFNHLNIDKVRVRWGNSESSQRKRPKWELQTLEYPGKLIEKFHYSGMPNPKGRQNYIAGNLDGSTTYAEIVARIGDLGGTIH